MLRNSQNAPHAGGVGPPQPHLIWPPRPVCVCATRSLPCFLVHPPRESWLHRGPSPSDIRSGSGTSLFWLPRSLQCFRPPGSETVWPLPHTPGKLLERRELSER
ncbi:hypothetical protein T484DRAFT_1931710 [Baffinella frigidus]|nr:hypothetical protein T484DRAFT_1931710 [Cryptophyta sp. CCMP2293]